MKALQIIRVRRVHWNKNTESWLGNNNDERAAKANILSEIFWTQPDLNRHPFDLESNALTLRHRSDRHFALIQSHKFLLQYIYEAKKLFTYFAYPRPILDKKRLLSKLSLSTNNITLIQNVLLSKALSLLLDLIQFRHNRIIILISITIFISVLTLESNATKNFSKTFLIVNLFILIN